MVSSFEEAETKIIDELKKNGFGILTEINVKETLKKKIDVDFRKYKILGACNPQFAYEALKTEDKIGVLFPCSVVIQELDNPAEVEVAIMNPLEAMKSIGKPEMLNFAEQIAQKLQSALSNL
ncbi:MAG: hypothetical protein CO129_07665 [Ignavibacteriales bacterium CG_4_9_14_3_um_filter_34_10]|nr:MAG: hypothetical protein CO129_07665 [Ignavibacteriales bacterium CG_4_9_14_3_um_filter_34_10]